MGNNRLLFVDDEIEICKIVEEVAAINDYEVTAVTSAEDFRAAYQSVDPSLIIIDLHLQGEDGVQLLRFLDHELCRTPIILISGYDDKILTTAMLLGQSYGLKTPETLHKPLKIAQFSSVLQKYKTTKIPLDQETIDAAIANHEFILHYQPQISLADKKLMGVEALVRWQPPNKPLIFPDDFIPEVEKNNLIIPLTDYVINAALQQASDWKQKGIELAISINLSAKYLVSLEIPDYFESLAKKYNINPDKIYWEITETAITDKPKIIMDILTRLRLKNFNLSMDDFGTGYSSMLLLHTMPFNQIKIDKQFVTLINEETELQMISQSLIQLFRQLNIETVAEGVETDKVMQHLLDYQCNIGQGYFIAKPLAVSQLEEWMSEKLDKKLRYKPFLGIKKA